MCIGAERGETITALFRLKKNRSTNDAENCSNILMLHTLSERSEIDGFSLFLYYSFYIRKPSRRVLRVIYFIRQ